MTNKEQKYLSIDFIKQLIKYNHLSGELIWNERPLDWFKTDNHGKTWNSRFANKVITSTNSLGYIRFTLLGKTFLAHRIAWAIYHGKFADGEIDHINHIRNDNRIINLRNITQKQNQQNRALAKTNKSGFVGVDFVKKHKKFRARIFANDKRICLGMFKNIDEAIEARVFANKKYGFHENHGVKLND